LTISRINDAIEGTQSAPYEREFQKEGQMSFSPATSVPRSNTATPAPAANAATLASLRRGASWFYTIAVLSGINSLLQVFDARIHFIFGLGITQVAGAAAKQSSNGTVVLLLVDGLFIGLLLLCGKWARERSQGAFLGGMIAYALDGVLLVLFGVWIDAAVHAYALYRMWQGYAASRELADLEQAAQPGLSRAGAV
jgi:hypothetical protein